MYLLAVRTREIQALDPGHVLSVRYHDCTDPDLKVFFSRHMHQGSGNSDDIQGFVQSIAGDVIDDAKDCFVKIILRLKGLCLK